MTQQVNQQIIVDELLRRVNALTVENIVLSAQVRELQAMTQQDAGQEQIIPAE